MAKKPGRDVSPGPKGGWEVTKPGAGRASAHTRTQSEAEQRRSRSWGRKVEEKCESTDGTDASGIQTRYRQRTIRIRPRTRSTRTRRPVELGFEEGSQVIYKQKRYLGNTNNLEVHDTSNESSNCQLDEIKSKSPLTHI